MSNYKSDKGFKVSDRDFEGLDNRLSLEVDLTIGEFAQIKGVKENFMLYSYMVVYQTLKNDEKSNYTGEAKKLNEFDENNNELVYADEIQRIRVELSRSHSALVKNQLTYSPDLKQMDVPFLKYIFDKKKHTKIKENTNKKGDIIYGIHSKLVNLKLDKVSLSDYYDYTMDVIKSIETISSESDKLLELYKFSKKNFYIDLCHLINCLGDFEGKSLKNLSAKEKNPILDDMICHSLYIIFSLPPWIRFHHTENFCIMAMDSDEENKVIPLGMSLGINNLFKEEGKSIVEWLRHQFVFDLIVGKTGNVLSFMERGIIKYGNDFKKDFIGSFGTIQINGRHERYYKKIVNIIKKQNEEILKRYKI